MSLIDISTDEKVVLYNWYKAPLAAENEIRIEFEHTTYLAIA